jgi:hypothetical protein
MTSSRTKIRFNFDTMKWEGLTMEQVKIWEGIYDDVDIAGELKKMIFWLNENRDTKKAHKKNWHRFITKWLKRSQLRALNLV